MMENSEKPPPQEIASDPEKLVEWFDSSKSAKEALDKTDKGEGTASSCRCYERRLKTIRSR